MLVEKFWVGARSSSVHRNVYKNCWKVPFLTPDTKSINVPSGCTYYTQKFAPGHFVSISWKNFLKIFLLLEFLQLLHFCLIWIFLFLYAVPMDAIFFDSVNVPKRAGSQLGIRRRSGRSLPKIRRLSFVACRLKWDPRSSRLERPKSEKNF